MHKLIIKTKYNIIKLMVNDINSPEVKEILEQPYVVETKVEEIKNDDIKSENIPFLKVLSRKKSGHF